MNTVVSLLDLETWNKICTYTPFKASLRAQLVKNLPAMQETLV